MLHLHHKGEALKAKDRHERPPKRHRRAELGHAPKKKKGGK